MNLTAENVETVFKDCLFLDGEIPNDHPPNHMVKVEGIMHNFGFHSERLNSHKEDVVSMLTELPDDFRAGSGGGASFLNACMTKSGIQWGEHINIEQLVALGIGLGVVSYCLPKAMWSMLPGGMPYFVIKGE